MSTTEKLGPIEVTLAIKGDSPLPELAPDALGKVTLGPNGFLALLETQLGIPTCDISFTSRLIQYLGCIDQVNQPQAFYHTSYQADPFSVARTLLQWRDQWYLAGWQGSFNESVPGKLSDMAAIEQLAHKAVDLGTGQRLQRVIHLLPDNPVAISTITLRDELADFSHLWQQLINAVAVPIVQCAPSLPQGNPDSDLHALQQHLLQNASSGTPEKIRLRGDGTVIVIQADSPQESTPLTALLTQNWLQTSPNQSIALLAESRGELLDNTLEHINSPRLGFSSLSPWRPVFQVLPLACELLWEPLNPTALFQFLSHSVGPIPIRIRSALAQLVANTPGIGSQAWEETIKASLDKEDKTKRKKLENSIRYWLESPRFAPRSGVDCDILAERAQNVADWLQRARESKDDPAWKSLYNIALNQAQEFVHAIERLQAHGRDKLTQDNVRRLIEDVRGTGAAITDRHAEVIPGCRRVLRADHAGAFNATSPENTVDNVIWWNCQATDRVQRWPWSRSERAALTNNAIYLQSEEAQLNWLGKAWLRPVLTAKERCIFILHNDADRHHPIWDQIISSTEGLPILQVASDNTATHLGVAKRPLQARSLPPKVRWWQLPESLRIPVRASESFSSLDTYIHSPYQWLLHHAARLRPGSLASVSDGNILKGNLAHRLFETFFNEHPAIKSIASQTIDNWVDTHITELLQQEGALLLEPGRQAECEQFITQVQHALTTLVEHLQSADVINVQMELWQEGQYLGGELNGYIDVLAIRADGSEAVIDIKWGGKKYRRDALLANSYLQLATYAQLRRNNGAELSPALSYFIVQGAHMLSLDHTFFPDAERLKPEDEESVLQYWQRVEQSWHWRKSQFDQGLVEVTVSDTDPTADSVPGEDCLQIPEASDRFNDYSTLTGWGTNA